MFPRWGTTQEDGGQWARYQSASAPMALSHTRQRSWCARMESGTRSHKHSTVMDFPAFRESVEVTSRAFRSKAMGFWKPGDECRVTGVWNPSMSLAMAFSACWRDCRGEADKGLIQWINSLLNGQMSSELMVLKKVRRIRKQSVGLFFDVKPSSCRSSCLARSSIDGRRLPAIAEREIRRPRLRSSA
jgi:hypothetical protein